MRGEDIRSMTDEELAAAERNVAEEMWKLRFQHHTGQLTNTAVLRKQKKTLARILTEKTARTKGLSVAPVKG